MSCFDDAPEFIDEDNRRFRTNSPVSRQQMEAKHAALFPEKIIKGKTILDLGSCMGTTGHWCLAHGATHYTGIEVQKEYAENARQLLDRYHPGKATIHQSPIEQWLQQQPAVPTYDIVCLLGVLYAFTDYFSILKLSTALTRSIFAIEGLYFDFARKHPNFRGVLFMDDQRLNLSSQKGSVRGRGARISPKGLEWLMQEFAFTSPEGVIPYLYTSNAYNHSLDTKESRLPVRYLMRFIRTNEIKARSVSDDLQHGGGIIESWGAKNDVEV